LLRTLLIVLALAIASTTAGAQSNQPTSGGMAEFFRGIVGEWVGVCKQSTDGQPTDDKYFHAVISESEPSTFTARFDYYGVDAGGVVSRIGGSSVTTTIAASGLSATGKIIGDGVVSLDRKLRKQEHNITESLTLTSAGAIEARGTGAFRVFGMPLGLGKLGKVRDDQSVWSFSTGTLSIRQSSDTEAGVGDVEKRRVAGSRAYMTQPRRKTRLLIYGVNAVMGDRNSLHAVVRITDSKTAASLLLGPA